MKIAVPTQDGLKIAENLEDATAFFVLTFKAGEIVNEELRGFAKHEPFSANPDFPNIIKDCQFIVVSKIRDTSCQTLRQAGIQCVQTKETFITNIAIQAKEEILLKESNTICCP